MKDCRTRHNHQNHQRCQDMGIAASEIQAAFLTRAHQLRAPATPSTFTRTQHDAEQCLPGKCVVQIFQKFSLQYCRNVSGE